MGDACSPEFVEVGVVFRAVAAGCNGHSQCAAAAGSGDDDAVCGAGHGCVIVAQVANGGFDVHNLGGGVGDIVAGYIFISSWETAAAADIRDDVARLQRLAHFVVGAVIVCTVRD